jgi:hypothetical protein
MTISYDSCNFKIIETGEGFLKAKVTATHPSVLKYWTPDGLVKKAKLPEDVLSQATIDSLRGIPVTLEHPRDEGGSPVMINPDNHSQFAKGSFSEPKIENGEIVGLMTVCDSDAIEKIKSGAVGVSIGYYRDEVIKPGDYSGEHYDLFQTNIRGNHLAITDNPRSDRAGISFDSNYIDEYYKKEGDMPKYVLIDKDGKIDEGKMLSFRTSEGNDISIDSRIMDEIDAVKKTDEIKGLKADIDSKDEEIKKQAEKIDELENKDENEEIKTLKADVDSKDNEIEGLKKKLEDQKADFDSNIEKSVDARVNLVSQAKALEIDVDGKSDNEIKKDVISKYMPDAKDLSDADIDAHYKASIVIAENEKKPAQHNNDVDSKSIEQMRAEYTENSQKLSQE